MNAGIRSRLAALIKELQDVWVELEPGSDLESCIGDFTDNVLSIDWPADAAEEVAS